MRHSARKLSQNPTGSKGIAAHALEDAVEKAFLLAAGDVEIVRKVFRPGVDHTRDIEEVNRALSDLREDREAGLYSSELGKQEYREAYKRLDARREQLIAQPTRPDAWEEFPTGETYRERWSTLSTQHEKGRELRAAGVKAVIHAKPIPGMTAAQLMAPDGHDGMWQHPVERVQVLIPVDIKQRLRSMAAVHSEG
ncbi:hypothetical protein [Streptomyces sp. GSL17-111]|uniref:hypothetical protein n=1 Tax=Streptomyces sp. GSL17-111 TaxID=3121596 RepID=UPI0030F4A1DC